MFTELNASGYTHKNIFYNAEFEDILAKIIACYNLMVVDNLNLSNDENSIRDVLLISYLKNNSVRNKIQLTDFLFDREVPEDLSIGRTDIKIQTLNTFADTGAYYTIECKRLDAVNTNGKTGLNALYIKNGISRFVSKSYSSHYKTNGMIGFLVQELDIHQNIIRINNLMKNSFKEANLTRDLISRSVSVGFDFSYCSTHIINSEEITIYHLMLDFSKNIIRNT
jgi:hypothetical protein